MPVVIRQPNADTNPILAGGVYGKYITKGRPYYWVFDGTNLRFILLISDGGRYGLDKIDFIEYKGTAITDFIFHRGTITKQISPKTVQSIDTSTNTLTANAHGFSDTNTVRVGVINGLLPPELSLNGKYFVRDSATNTLKLALTSGGTAIDLTATGNDIIIWKADAGFDDPNQGLPTYCPEVNTTFNNIAYIEGKIPAVYSTEGTEPEWENFRIQGTGRRLMDYDNTGAELGIIEDDESLLQNVGLQIADNAFVGLGILAIRWDFPSWKDLRDASAVKIWQRPSQNQNTVPVAGNFTGRYYSGNDFDVLIGTQEDAKIDFDFGTGSPIAGMPTTNYSIRWDGKIQPTFSEVYTFAVNHDDTARVFLDGNLIYETVGVGSGTFAISLTANQIYDLRVELIQATSTCFITVAWSSASQTSQPIPAVSLDTQTVQVDRYANSMASPELVEASEYHERLMERAVGWDWTDDNGLIKFLAPDRPVSFAFKFDAIDDSSQANFAKASFTKKRRRLNVRKNFQLFKIRILQLFGYPTSYVQGDRPQIRRFQRSLPNNDSATDLGVMTRSLGERMAEMQMQMKADPKYSIEIEGLRGSSIIRKNHFLTVSYFDNDGNYVEDEKHITTLHSWGSKDGKNAFQGLPIPTPYYTDEELIVYEEEAPTSLVATWSSGTHKGFLTWVNNHGQGSNLIERQDDGGSWTLVAILPFNSFEWYDETITINGNYNYRVKNANVATYSNEDDFDVASESEPSANIPTDLALSETDGVVTCDWVNHGGTGDNKIQRKQAGEGWAIVGTVGSGVATFDDESITLDGDYIYRVYNEDEIGYTDEETITVDVPDGGGEETGTHPDGLYVLESHGVIRAHWTNHGGTGDNLIEVDVGGIYDFLAVADSLDTSKIIEFPSAGTYSLRISNSSCTGYDYTDFYWDGGEI